MTEDKSNVEVEVGAILKVREITHTLKGIDVAKEAYHLLFRTQTMTVAKIALVEVKPCRRVHHLKENRKSSTSLIVIIS